MAAAAQFTGHAYAVGLGLHAVKLDALIRIVALNALQPIEEVEMPPRAAELTVSHHMQATGALLLNNVANRVIFNISQRAGIDFTAGKFESRLFDRIRT
ncbi:hypothetical protein D3C72_1659210 [compost metagenome]